MVLNRAPRPEELLRLYRLAGWVAPEADGEFIPAMLRGSLLVVTACAPDGALVGFARVISDGASDAYIQDVVVDPAYRRRGIAHRMVSMLVAEARSRGIDWIGLIGAPDTRQLYEKLGFREMSGHLPMVLTELS